MNKVKTKLKKVIKVKDEDDKKKKKLNKITYETFLFILII